MKKTVSVCTRVEGHGDLNIFLDKNEISRVNFELQVIRGFESILKNKKLVDVPRISARVCGLCHAAHAIVSCKTIENMFDIKPSDQSIDIRRLLMVGELINSDSMHFFFQAFPDLVVFLKEKPKALSLNELTQFDPILTANMFELIKMSKELTELLGGRASHFVTPVIGGISRAPSKKTVNIIRKILQKAVNNLKSVIEIYQTKFPDPLPQEFTLSDPIYMGLQNHGKYDFYEGKLRMKQNDALLADFNCNEYAQHFDRRNDVQGELPGVYTIAKGAERILTGPLSRFHVIDDYDIGEVDPYLEFIDTSWKNNILLSNYLRLIEMLAASFQGLAILDDPKLSNPIHIPSLNMKGIKRSEAIGVVEAPRGTLIHHYKVNEKYLLEHVKLLVATEINIPTINAVLTRLVKDNYAENKDLDIAKTYAQMVLRTFDPCIACATH